MYSIKEYLIKKYNTTVLTKQQLADELQISISTINRYMSFGGIGLPRYVRVGIGSRSRVIFPIEEVAKFLEENDSREDSKV